MQAAEATAAQRSVQASRLKSGAATKLANASEHDARASAFATNPSVRPGLEGQNATVIANQQRDRIALTPLPFLLAGLLALIIAIVTVAGHATRLARAKPITALRYE